MLKEPNSTPAEERIDIVTEDLQVIIDELQKLKAKPGVKGALLKEIDACIKRVELALETLEIGI